MHVNLDIICLEFDLLRTNNVFIQYVDVSGETILDFFVLR